MPLKTRTSDTSGAYLRDEGSFEAETGYPAAFYVYTFTAKNLNGDCRVHRHIIGTGVPTGQGMGNANPGDLYFDDTANKWHHKIGDVGTDTWELQTSA